MKIRIIIIAALCLVVFCLGACGYWDGSGSQGIININFENSGARYAVDTDTMIYKITLTSPGKSAITKTTKKGDASISIPVSEGTWGIKVQAEGDRVTGKGEHTLKVTAGNTASAKIGMTVTGTRVYTWDELSEDFAELEKADGKLKDLDNIEIKEDLDADSGLKSTKTTKTITLWTKKDVTIKRKSSSKDDPVFTIENCTLILDGTKGGKITIDGDKSNITNPSSSRALINVQTNSTLRMLDGVTITNNVSSSTSGGGKGGGIYVDHKGKFYMDGGVISDNRAGASGGGVHLETGGELIKTGGTIYGLDEGSNSNVAGSEGRTNGDGQAVYFLDSRISINNTLKSDSSGNWPKP